MTTLSNSLLAHKFSDEISAGCIPDSGGSPGCFLGLWKGGFCNYLAISQGLVWMNHSRHWNLEIHWNLNAYPEVLDCFLGLWVGCWCRMIMIGGIWKHNNRKTNQMKEIILELKKKKRLFKIRGWRGTCNYSDTGKSKIINQIKPNQLYIKGILSNLSQH